MVSWTTATATSPCPRASALRRAARTGREWSATLGRCLLGVFLLTLMKVLPIACIADTGNWLSFNYYCKGQIFIEANGFSQVCLLQCWWRYLEQTHTPTPATPENLLGVLVHCRSEETETEVAAQQIFWSACLPTAVKWESWKGELSGYCLSSIVFSYSWMWLTLKTFLMQSLPKYCGL